MRKNNVKPFLWNFIEEASNRNDISNGREPLTKSVNEEGSLDIVDLL